MIPYLLQKEFRDFWGNFDAAFIRQLELLDQSGCCLVPRLYRVPTTSEDEIEEGAYKRASVQIAAGSWLFGIKHQGIGPGFDVQVTDTSLGRTLFTAPVSAAIFTNTAAAGEDLDPRMPWFLPGLYPIIDPGVFTVEIWRHRDAGADLERCSIVLVCAEVLTDGRY